MNDGACRQEIHQGTKNNQDRCDRGCGKGCLWYPPELMHWCASLKEEEQQIHCGCDGKIAEADGDSLYDYQHKRDPLPASQKPHRYTKIPVEDRRAANLSSIINGMHGRLISHNSKLSTCASRSCQGWVVEMSAKCHRNACDVFIHVANEPGDEDIRVTIVLRWRVSSLNDNLVTNFRRFRDMPLLIEPLVSIYAVSTDSSSDSVSCNKLASVLCYRGILID
jgi:hypothetical protein